MSVKFEKSAYLAAAKGNETFDSKEKISIFSNLNTQFQYGTVTLQKFNQDYKAQGWFGRKIVALPLALTGIIKAIYHFAKGIFVGLIKTCTGDKKYIKGHLFYAARDLQETFGWFVTLFNDRIGQYHIQESKFHKSCYDCFLDKIIIKSKSYSLEEFDEKLQEIKYYNFETKRKEKKFAKIANAYLMKGDLEKALKTIKELFNDNQTKDAFISKIAESYYSKGNIEQALKTIEFFFNRKPKETFIIKIATDYLNKNERENALKAIKKIVNSDSREPLLSQLEDLSYRNGDLNCLYAIKDLYFHPEKKKTIINRIISIHLSLGQWEKALKMTDTNKESLYMNVLLLSPSLISKIAEHYCNVEKMNVKESFKIKQFNISQEKKAAFILNIAESYINKGYIEQAYETVEHLNSYFKDKDKDSLLSRIATAYLNKGNLEEALNIINKQIFPFDKGISLKYKIAEAYYDKGNLDKALNLAKQLITYFRMDSFIVKIGNAYLNKNELENAKETFKRIYGDVDLKNSNLLRVAKQFFVRKDQANVLLIIREIGEKIISKKINEDRKYIDDYYQSILLQISSTDLKDFFNNLTQICFERTKIYFSNINFNNEKTILQEIINTFTDNSTINGFINLSKKRSQSTHSSYSYYASSSQNYSHSQSKTKSTTTTYHPNEKYFSILGLSNEATKNDVEKAFRKFSLTMHPDKVHQNENESNEAFEKRKNETLERFKEILNAKEELIKSFR